MRIGFVGVCHHHLPVFVKPITEMPDHQIVGVSDSDLNVARQEAERLGCSAYQDFRELVVRERPDFVFALGRHSEMPDEASFLIEEGIPFVMEKPGGRTYTEVRANAEQATRKGSFVAVALGMRNSALYELLDTKLATDNPAYVLFRWFGPSSERYRDPRWSWLLDPAVSGGGALINLGVHHVDWFRSLVRGAPVSVKYAVMKNRAEGNPAEDYCLLVLEGGGALGVLETGYLSPGSLAPRVDQKAGWIAAPANPVDMHYLIRTDRHHISVHGLKEASIIDLQNGGTSQFQGTTTQDYTFFVQDVLERVRSGKPPRANLTDMAETMKVVDDAYRVAGATLQT